MGADLAGLLLLAPVEDVADGEHARVRGQLERRVHPDEARVGERAGAEGRDEGRVRARAVRGDLRGG